jgi:hypothetical protein
MVDLGSWEEAFAYVRNVSDCSGEHALKLAQTSLAHVKEPIHSRWLQLEVDLGNAYLRLGCYPQAEAQFSGVIGQYGTTPSIEAQAKSGLDRALAHQRG